MNHEKHTSRIGAARNTAKITPSVGRRKEGMVRRCVIATRKLPHSKALYKSSDSFALAGIDTKVYNIKKLRKRSDSDLKMVSLQAIRSPRQ